MVGLLFEGLVAGDACNDGPENVLFLVLEMETDEQIGLRCR